jgi:hypothetical protein
MLFHAYSSHETVHGQVGKETQFTPSSSWNEFQEAR